MNIDKLERANILAKSLRRTLKYVFRIKQR